MFGGIQIDNALGGDPGPVFTGLKGTEAPAQAPQEMKLSSAQQSLDASYRRHEDIKRLESTFQAIKTHKDAADARLERAIKEKNKALGEVQRLEALKQNSGVRTITAMHHLTNGDALNTTTTAKILNSMPVATQPQIGTKLRLAKIALYDAQKIVNENRTEKMDLLKQAMTPIEEALKIHREILGQLAHFAEVNNEMNKTIEEIVLHQLPLASDSEIRRFIEIRDKNKKAEQEQSLTTTVSNWFMRTMKLI